jgi:hypothetical protein
LYSVPLRDALEQIKMGYGYKEDLDTEDVVWGLFLNPQNAWRNR